MPSNPQELKPEEVNEEIETLDFNNPDYSFFPEGRHVYRQQGYYLVCISCELQHAIFIGPEKHMVGETEEGLPILKKVG
jgi:hypothetical protein